MLSADDSPSPVWTGVYPMLLPTVELDVVLHRLPIQGVEHGMTGPVSRACAAVRLAAAPKVEGLAAKGALVNLAILRA
jgi:hypothetical protein